MTNINSPQDFLRALEENPQWKEAVRAQILGEEVLQLPVRFNAFMIRTEAFMERTEAFMADQTEFNRQVTGFMERTEAFMADQTEFNRKVEGFMERTDAMIAELVDLNRQQAEFNRQVLVRLGRMEGDIGNLKGFYGEYKVVQHARFVVRELDDSLRYVRTVPSEEMEQLGLQAIAEGLLPRGEWRSFMEADLVIETADGDEPCYFAVEISYTGDPRDVERARRNASILSDLKRCRVLPVVASVRNVDEVDEDVQTGRLRWYQISQQQLAR